ncbi:MAG: hypothetical protein PVF33_07910 [Candidatus Latescibacterota bacterium]
MKASIFDHNKLRTCLAICAVVLAIACSNDDEGGGTDVEGEVSIQTIIVAPKAAEPGDTLTVTATLSGASAPGDYPSVSWSGSGGEIINSSQLSIDWIAPDTPGVYRLTCDATIDQSSDQDFVDVFVGEPVLSVNQNGGEIRLRPTQGEFYYLNSIPFEEQWDSSRVYVQTSGVPEPVVPGVRVGAQFVFSSDLNQAAYVANTAGSGNFTNDPEDIFVIDLNGRTERVVTTDGAAPSSVRRYQHTYPYFSPNGNWITYQKWRPNPQAGNIDTLDVAVCNLQTDEETVVTDTDRRTQRKNLFPTYSTNGNWLVFVSDRTKQNTWDFFGNRLTGGGAIADTTVQLTTGGLVGLGSVGSLGTPMLQWNPAQPVLAMVGGGGSDEGLHLVSVTTGGANVANVTDVGNNILEIAWSGNGQILAVSALVDAASGEGVENAIFTVTTAGTVTRRHTARADDRVFDMGWSNDGKFLVYRLVRRSNSWLKLLDVDGGTNLTAPLSLIGEVSDGNRATYSLEMSTAARYGTGNTVYYALFDLDITAQGTPTIWTLDVTSVVQP